MKCLLSLAAVLSLLVSGVRAESDPAASIGQKIENFSLRDYRGADRSLDDFRDAKLVVVCFLGTECPLARLYAPRLVELEKRFAEQGVAVLAVNSNQQDSLSEIAAYAKAHEIEFPILKDVGNVVADRVGAERTPEVFVLDQQRVVRYRGRIDDQYGVGIQRRKPTRHDLAAAIVELLAGKAVSQPLTAAPGCFIGRIAEPDAKSDVTYSRDIAPILQSRCVECHRPGQIAPMALTKYAEVAGWAETIAEVIDAGRMPPWHANPEYGHFANDARLKESEKELIARWVEAGAPEGDRCQLPPAREFVEGWRIGEPNRVVYMADKPFDVPAEGEVRYQYFTVDPGFKQDTWIQAAECRPGNRAIVHHIIVGILPPDGRRRGTGGELDSDWLTATAPGARPLLLPQGMAKRVPANSKLVFQMHYTPNGTAQSDRSCVGLVFADPQTVRKEVGTWKAATHKFAIPPHAENHRVEAWHTFSKDSLLLALFPHMHLRGKSFRYEAHYPDGRSEILLDVPRYDFNWQNSYELAEPKRLPAGTRIHCVAHFDNSENNLANPDPTDTVRWGDQTWEEMMIGYFDMALADQDLLANPPAPSKTRTERFRETGAKFRPEEHKKLHTLADKALDSPADFEKLAAALPRIVPQLDRVCLTVASGGKLQVRFDAQSEALRQMVGGRGIEVPAARMGLTEFAKAEKPTVQQDLTAASQPDLKLMSRAFGSSLHVPVSIDGQPGTINFWSRESDAFPAAAVEFLVPVAERMGKGR